jgi:colanic acid/amylovoran biosynthesis glycosyltransferase
MSNEPRVLYMSGSVPVRSETFVYREILTLRDLGIDVRTASVHAPMHGLDEGVLNQMAQESVTLYSSGKFSIIRDMTKELISRPFRTVSTMLRVLLDSMFSTEVSLKRKPKVIWQGITGVALARRVRSMGISHIHAHMAHVPTTIAMYAAKQLGISFSFTGHAIDLFPNRTLLREKIQRALYVNCISQWHRVFYQGIHHRSDEDLPIVRCGVDTTKYQTSPAPSGEVLKILGIGRLVEKKGFDVLIEAARIIGERGILRLEIRIGGSGPESSRLKELALDLPDGISVELLGETDNDTVMELMNQADVFALPCRIADSGDRDGIPVVLMEAMARGRCVISGDLETIRELIEHDVSGVMIRPGNQDDLVESLIKLANNREKVDELGKKARKRIEEEFDLSANGQRIVHALRTHGVLEG